VLQGVDLAVLVLAGPADDGAIEPQRWQQRESADRLGGQLQSVAGAIHLDQLPDDGRPGVPQIRPGLQCLAQRDEQLVGSQHVPSMRLIGQQAITEDGLANQLAFDERQCLAALGGGLANVHEPANSVIGID